MLHDERIQLSVSMDLRDAFLEIQVRRQAPGDLLRAGEGGGGPLLGLSAGHQGEAALAEDRLQELEG